MIAIRATTDRAGLSMGMGRIQPTLHAPSTQGAELDYAPALSFPRHATAQGVIDALRMMRPGDESVYYLFVTDEEDRLVGVVSLRQVVTARPETRLDSIMSRTVLSLPANLPPVEQAHILGGSGFLALPVVDADGRLVGSRGATELLYAIEHESTEDLYRLAGVARTETIRQPVGPSLRVRLGWLGLTLLGAWGAAAIINAFSGVIVQIALLAVFLPIVLSVGSQAGTQTLTFMVRSLTLGDLNLTNAWRSLRRELLIGLGNGLGLGFAVGLIGWFWQGSIVLGMLIALTMIGTLLIAALVGVIVPLALKALRIDPALASAFIVSSAIQVSGVGLLFGLAALVL